MYLRYSISPVEKIGLLVWGIRFYCVYGAKYDGMRDKGRGGVLSDLCQPKNFLMNYFVRLGKDLLNDYSQKFWSSLVFW